MLILRTNWYGQHSFDLDNQDMHFLLTSDAIKYLDVLALMLSQTLNYISPLKCIAQNEMRDTFTDGPFSMFEPNTLPLGFSLHGGIHTENTVDQWPTSVCGPSESNHQGYTTSTYYN